MRRKPPSDAVWHHPVDDLEPEADSLSESADMLSGFLRAVAEQPTACRAGVEALAHIALACPTQFPGGFHLPSQSLDGDYRTFGIAFSRLFSLITAGWTHTRTSEAGRRAIAAVYVLRPDLLGGATLHDLGIRFGGCTRQNLSKHARAIRDAHRGIKNRAMKSEETRKRCQQTHRLL
jgi:hypothetical protein